MAAIRRCCDDSRRRAVWGAVEQPQRPLFVVSMTRRRSPAGARETLEALREVVGRQRGFDVMQTGETASLGRAARPGAQARRQHVLYGNITPTRSSRSRRPPPPASRRTRVRRHRRPGADGVQQLADIYWEMQVRWLMRAAASSTPRTSTTTSPAAATRASATRRRWTAKMSSRS